MTEAIIVALITGGLSLTGVVATCLATSRKQESKQEANMAVMNAEIKELTREVRIHNGFAERIPVLENEVRVLKSEIAILRQYHQQPN